MPTGLTENIYILHKLILDQLRFPEMFRLSRTLTDPERSLVDMDTVAHDSRTLWGQPGHVPVYRPEWFVLAREYLDALYDYALTREPDDEEGAWSRRGILRTFVLLDRQRAYLFQLLHAYLDVTRTHQETFYNAVHHYEMHESVDSSKREVADFLLFGW